MWVKFARFVIVVSALWLPSCLIYDESLLGSDSDSNPSTGGDGSASGGATPGSGGAGTGSMPATGGDLGTGGAAPSGGGTATGGNVGTGGSTSDCSGVGTTMAYTDVTAWTYFPDAVASTALIDNLNGFDHNFVGNTGTFNGNWQTGVDDPTNTSLNPTGASWTNYQDPCLPADNLSLHATGTGYKNWGASFNAELKSPIANVDVTAYDGVVFWARSAAATNQKIRIDFADDTHSVTTTELTIQANSKWKAYQVKFPVGLTLTKVRIVYISAMPVADDTSSFDFWIDDPSFYVAAP